MLPWLYVRSVEFNTNWIWNCVSTRYKMISMKKKKVKLFHSQVSHVWLQTYFTYLRASSKYTYKMLHLLSYYFVTLILDSFWWSLYCCLSSKLLAWDFPHYIQLLEQSWSVQWFYYELIGTVCLLLLYFYIIFF